MQLKLTNKSIKPILLTFTVCSMPNSKKAALINNPKSCLLNIGKIDPGGAFTASHATVKKESVFQR